jgi:methyl-accepting chemotaxis protein
MRGPIGIGKGKSTQRKLKNKINNDGSTFIGTGQKMAAPIENSFLLYLFLQQPIIAIHHSVEVTMAEPQASKDNVRKPFSNFLIKRSLQVRIIMSILFIMVMTGLLTTVILAWFGNVKSQGGTFYYMSNDVLHDLELTSILGVILPSLIAAQLVSFVIAVAVGMFSSRKVAVPIYKIEKWANELKTGNLTTRLSFREQDSMKDLSGGCNAVTDFYRKVFGEIASSVAGADPEKADAAKMKAALLGIKKSMGQVRLE